jgi:ParB-like nuclease family protein
VSDRNHIVSPSSSDSFSSFNETDPPPETARGGFREGLPPAFRMRADAHYVEQLDGTTPTITVQYIAVHAIDVSDAPADALPELVESIKRYGVLEPLVVQRNNGTYKTITGQKRLAAARAAGLHDVPCLVHHVSDERAETLRAVLRPPTLQPARIAGVFSTSESALDVAVAAMRLIGAAPDGQVSVVQSAMGPRLTIDLPFNL